MIVQYLHGLLIVSGLVLFGAVIPTFLAVAVREWRDTKAS